MQTTAARLMHGCPSGLFPYSATPLLATLLATGAVGDSRCERPAARTSTWDVDLETSRLSTLPLEALVVAAPRRAAPRTVVRGAVSDGPAVGTQVTSFASYMDSFPEALQALRVLGLFRVFFKKWPECRELQAAARTRTLP